MIIVKDEIPLEELKKIAVQMFGDLVKAVVDLEREIMAIGGELRSKDLREHLIILSSCFQRSVDISDLKMFLLLSQDIFGILCKHTQL